MVKNRRVLCPTCRKQTVYDVRQSFRPFCSERCQILDLGKWADEKFRIASEEHARLGSEQGEDDDCRVPRHHLN